MRELGATPRSNDFLAKDTKYNVQHGSMDLQARTRNSGCSGVKIELNSMKVK